MGLYFSFYLFKLGLAPPIQDLYGKVNFTGMALCRENWAESCQGGFATNALGSRDRRGKPWMHFAKAALKDAHPSVGVFCTPLGLAGEWELCWLPLLQWLVLSSAASALLQRKRSTT